MLLLSLLALFYCAKIGLNIKLWRSEVLSLAIRIGVSKIEQLHLFLIVVVKSNLERIGPRSEKIHHKALMVLLLRMLQHYYVDYF